VSRDRTPRPSLGGRARAALACLIVGSALIFPFEYALTLTLGVLVLLAFVVLGTLAIATPEYLAQRAGGDDAPGEDGPPGGGPPR
jgi:hypothetical protein